MKDSIIGKIMMFVALIMAVLAVAHSEGFFNPFNDVMPTPPWLDIITGIAIGIVFVRGLDYQDS